jgi:hypothetical protein
MSNKQDRNYAVALFAIQEQLPLAKERERYMEVENLLAPRRKKFKLQFSHAGPKGKKQNVPQGSLLRARGNLLNGSGGRRNLRLDSLILRYSHRARSNSRALKDTPSIASGRGKPFCCR